MRYVFGFLCVCTLVGTLHQSASGQAGEEGATSEPKLEEPAPASEPAPEEPVLKLELDDAGVAVAPSAPRTAKGYTLGEMELRVKRAKIGLGASGGALFVGLVMGVAALSQITPLVCFFDCPPTPGWTAPVGAVGATLTAGGLVGVIASGVAFRRRKRDRDRLLEAHREMGLLPPPPEDQASEFAHPHDRRHR